MTSDSDTQTIGVKYPNTNIVTHTSMTVMYTSSTKMSEDHKEVT